MRRLVLVSALASALGTGSVAIAASIGVSSAKLTTYSAATSIPVSSCTLGAVADSYAANESPTQNFGTATDLFVRSGNKPKRTFVQFDLAGCPVPAGALIVSANLQLHLGTAPGQSRTYEVRRVAASWTETGLTWNNQPSVAGSATATVATGTVSAVDLSWNVASDAQAFADGTANYGWRVHDQNEGSGNHQGRFISREGAVGRQPVLSITYYP